MTYIKCSFCNKEIIGAEPSLPFIPQPLSALHNIGSSDLITYNNKPYHKACLQKYSSIIIKGGEDTLDVVLEHMKIIDLLYVIGDLSTLSTMTNISKTTRNILIKFSNIVCEHNSDYIMCCNPECKRLLLRTSALIGEKTKAYQAIIVNTQSENTITPESKDYKQNSVPHRVMYFCSKKCDGYFSSKLHNILQARMNEGSKKILEIQDKTKRSIDIYNNTAHSESEKKKMQSLLEAQCRSKVKIETFETLKGIKKITKEWIG